MTGVRRVKNGLELEFEPKDARPTAIYRLETAYGIEEKWNVVPTEAAIQPAQAGSRGLFRFPAEGAATFFRVNIE